MDRVKLTEQDWNYILEKYGKLYYTIANTFVTSDLAVWSKEDFIEELKLHTYKIVESFSKTAGLSFFEDFKDTVDFDKYYKTCIWNKRNEIGSRINYKSYEGYEILPVSQFKISDVGENSSNDSTGSLIESFETDTGIYPSFKVDKLPSEIEDVNLTKDQEKLVKLVIHDYSFYKPNGNISPSLVCKELKWSYIKFKKVLESLKEPFKTYKNAQEA